MRISALCQSVISFLPISGLPSLDHLWGVSLPVPWRSWFLYTSWCRSLTSAISRAEPALHSCFPRTGKCELLPPGRWIQSQLLPFISLLKPGPWMQEQRVLPKAHHGDIHRHFHQKGHASKYLWGASMHWALCSEWGSKVLVLSPHESLSGLPRELNPRSLPQHCRPLQYRPVVLGQSYAASRSCTHLPNWAAPFCPSVPTLCPGSQASHLPCFVMSEAAFNGQVPGLRYPIFSPEHLTVKAWQTAVKQTVRSWKPHHMKTFWRNGGCFAWTRKWLTGYWHGAWFHKHEKKNNTAFFKYLRGHHVSKEADFFCFVLGGGSRQ